MNIPFPDKKYQIIYADPPWEYKKTGGLKNSRGMAKQFYQTMSLEDICLLPIQNITDDNACLFLWTTYPKLPEALIVMKSWGFEYFGLGFEWIKLYTTPDKRATKKMIAWYLRLPHTDNHSDAVDRAIRDAVTELRKAGEPIISTAGAAGYWFDPSSVPIIVADMRSRIIDMSETIRALERGAQQTGVRQLELV